MSATYESISAPPNTPPSVADELAARCDHVAKVVRYFADRPWREVEPDSLKQLVGDNYQQRISDARKLGLRIVNVKRWATRADGTKQRLAGAYRLERQEPLGRDPSLPVTQAELFR